MVGSWCCHPTARPADIPLATAVETTNVFKLSAGDFKNFFSNDTAKVMGYVSLVAIATAPWDREGVNNGFNIPTTLFESGNVLGQFAFQIGAGFATYGIGKSVDNQKARRRRPRHRPRADTVAGAGADGEVHRAPRASRRQQQQVLPVRSLGQRVCHRHGAAASLRLEGRRAGLCARRLCGPGAHGVEPPSRHRRRHGCRLRHRVGTHRDHVGGEEQVQCRRAAAKSAARR